MQSHEVFTIGHSTLSVLAFVELLQANNVTAVADVRSTPYSRFNPGFNRENLKKELQTVGLGYVFMGKELGGRPSDPAHFTNGRASYVRMAQSEEFQQGLKRILDGRSTHRIALMCAEGDPLTCHRTLLVARALAERSVPVVHIGRGGLLETHEATEARLMQVTGVQEDLLHSRAETLAAAYELQAQRVAYAEPPAADAGAEAV